MSSIGKNIKKIRTVKKLSQAAFAEIFNLARPSVGAYEEGRAEPKIETIIQIAKYFGLSIDILLTKELTINELYRFDSLKTRDKSADSSVQQEKNQTRFNTTIISSSLFWDYIQDHDKTDFIDNQPKFNLPWLTTSTARAFEMDTVAMEFDNSGLQTGDLLVCEKKINNQKSLHNDYLYVFVTKENIIIRRLLEKNDPLKVVADNPDWPNTEIIKSDILEIWEVKYILSKNLSPPQRVNKRIANLEDKIDMLYKKYMQSLKG